MSFTVTECLQTNITFYDSFLLIHPFEREEIFLKTGGDNIGHILASIGTRISVPPHPRPQYTFRILICFPYSLLKRSLYREIVWASRSHTD